MDAGSIGIDTGEPQIQFYVLPGLVYAVVTPILLLFILVLFAFSYLVYRHQVITATPRQLESLIRLSEALARMRFSQWVEKKDVTEALRLLEVALQQSTTDHATCTLLNLLIRLELMKAVRPYAFLHEA